jgi:phage baseplate assembly protein V
VASSDGRGDLSPTYRFEEIERRLDHLLRVGQITQTQYGAKSAPKVKVLIDDNESNWIRIAAIRAGPDREWWVPEPGEQVIVFAPSGVTNAAFVFGSVNRDIHASINDNPDQHTIQYLDETVFQYDRKQHFYDVTNNHGDGHNRWTVTDDSEVLQESGRILLRIKDTFIEITDGKIVQSVNGTSITVTPGLVVHDAARSVFTGNLVVEGSIGTAGSVTAQGGIATAGSIAAVGAIDATGPISSASVIAGAVVVEAGSSITAIVAAAVAAQLAAQTAETAA